MHKIHGLNYTPVAVEEKLFLLSSDMMYTSSVTQFDIILRTHTKIKNGARIRLFSSYLYSLTSILDRN